MQVNERLKSLWGAREGLSEAEWDELYRLVFSILNRSHPSILRSLPESKEHYIQDFFLMKVFEPARHGSSSPHGANELCSFFNNFLIDVYRSAGLRTIDLVEDFDEVERNCEHLHENFMPADGEFFDHGITHQAVQRHAQSFLDELDDVGRVYLALHVCADSPEPLNKLAKRLRIPSYHYRALQLGITRKKGEYEKGYESTQIGGWLTKVLGLELSANSAILTALKILCLESLQRYQEPRSQE